MLAYKNRLQRLKAYAGAYLAFWVVFNVPEIRAAVLSTVEQLTTIVVAGADHRGLPGPEQKSNVVEREAPVDPPSESSRTRGERRLGETAFRPLEDLKSSPLVTYDLVMPIALLLLLGAVVLPLFSLISKLRSRYAAGREARIQELRREVRTRTRLRNGRLLDRYGRKLCACAILDRSDHGARIRLEQNVPPVTEIRFFDELAGVTYKGRVAWARGLEMGLALEIPKELARHRTEGSALPRLAIRDHEDEEEQEDAAEIHRNAQPDPRWHVELWDAATSQATFQSAYADLDDLLREVRPLLADEPSLVFKVKAPTLLEEEELAQLQELRAELI